MNISDIKKNLVYSTLFQVLSVITPFITAPYLSRVLGADGIGVQSYTASIQSYFLLFVVLGTTTYGAREIARCRNKKEKYSKAFWEIELMTIFTSLLCLIAWCVLIFTTTNYKLFYIAMIPNLFASAFDISWFFNGLEKFKLTATRNMFFKILGIVLMFQFVKNREDLIIYVVILSITTLLSSLSLWLYLPKLIRKVSIKELNIWSHFKQTIVYFIPTLATSIYTVLDKTLIGVITQDTAQNGYYEQAEKIIKIAKSISFTAINSVVGVRISFLFSEKKIDEIHKRIRNSMNYILFMGIGCACGIAGIAKNFVPIFFGKGYESVEYLLYLFCPIIVIIGISNCMGSQYYVPSGKRSQSARYLIIGAAINLILNLLFIPKYAAYGAVIASVIAEIVISVLYVAKSNRFMTVPLLIGMGSKKLIAGAVMLMSVIGIGTLRLPNGIFILLIQVVVGGAVYIIMLLILKDCWLLHFLTEFMKKFKRKG